MSGIQNIILITILALLIFNTLAILLYFINFKYDILEKITKLYKRQNISVAVNKSNKTKQISHILADSLRELSEKKLGALIVIEKKISLSNYISMGVLLNANISPFIFISIFSKSTPLHDGAVIIRRNKIACASTYLPNYDKKLPYKYGSRHRAALGISRKTDAVCFIVSETTGKTSYTRNGNLYELKNKNKLFSDIFPLIH